MKHGLFLIIGLFLTTFASALTVNWTNLTLDGPANGDAKGPGWCGLMLVSEAPTTKAAVLGYLESYSEGSYTAKTGDGAAISYFKVDGTKLYAGLSESSTVTMDPGTSTLDSGTTSATFVLFNLWDNTNTDTYRFATLTITDLDKLSGDTVTIDLTGLTLEWAENTLNATTFSAAPSVPEPTVLALLALGVAGLALKRRVK